MPAPPLPTKLAQVITRRGALSVADIVSAQRSTGTAYNSQNAEALQRLNQYSDLLNGSVIDVVRYLQDLSTYLQAFIIPAAGSASTVQNVFLVSGGNTIVPAPATANDGDTLWIITHQPATGDGFITWSSGFIGVTSNDNLMAPNAVNRYTFVRSGSFWNLMAPPSLGK